MASTKQKIGIAAALTGLLLAGGGTTGFVIYRLARSAHAGAPGDARPPAVAAQEQVTVGFSEDEIRDEKKRAEAGVRVARRVVNVVPPSGDPAENGDVMVFDVNGGTNADGTVFRTRARAVVRRSGARSQGLAPTAPGAPGGPAPRGYGGGAPAPLTPTPVPPPPEQ